MYTRHPLISHPRITCTFYINKRCGGLARHGGAVGGGDTGNSTFCRAVVGEPRAVPPFERWSSSRADVPVVVVVVSRTLVSHRSNRVVLLQDAPLRARRRRRLAAAVLSAMEQLPEQPHQRVRPTTPERELRRRHPRLRRTLRQGAQDGPVRLQSLLPGAVLRQSLSTPHRHPEGYQMAGVEGRRGVHV